MTLPQIAWAMGARGDSEEGKEEQTEAEFDRLWRSAISRVIRKFCVLPYELLCLDVITVCREASALLLLPKGPANLRIRIGNIKRSPISEGPARAVIVDYLRWLRNECNRL